MALWGLRHIRVARCRRVYGVRYLALLVGGDAGGRFDSRPETALRWSLVPGGGLWYVGLKAQAVTLAALVGLCVGSAFIFPRSGLGLAGLAAFVLCAAALWAVGARDAREVALTGLPSSMFLRDRRLFWVALAVLGLLLATGVLGLVAGAMSRPPSVPSPK